MTTARQLITDSAKLLGVVRKGEALTADEAVDGLSQLNDMLDAWANEGLSCISRTTESFVVASATSYTIGTGQTLNTSRPIKIVSAYFRVGTIDYPLTIVTDEEYSDIGLKTLSSSNPEFLHYNNGHPTGIIHLYPQAAGTLFLVTEKPLTSIAALSTTIDLPPGWNRALKNNLAIEMAAQFGVQTPAEVIKNAMTSKGSIQLAIAKQRPIKNKSPLVTKNIYSGYR